MTLYNGTMNVTIISVGKQTTGELQSLIEKYQKRLSSDMRLDWVFLPHSSSKDAEVCKIKESVAILHLLKPQDSLLLLDEHGSQQTNEVFANTFQSLSSTQGRLVIVIGGAYGVTKEIERRANFVWSLSRLVFPHQIVRLLLVEQLYRTTMILKGHPYHHV